MACIGGQIGVLEQGARHLPVQIGVEAQRLYPQIFEEVATPAQRFQGNSAGHAKRVLESTGNVERRQGTKLAGDRA